MCLSKRWIAFAMPAGAALVEACPRAGQRPDPGDRRELAKVRRDIAAGLAKWQAKHSKLCDWVAENIEETLTPAFAGAGFTIGCRCRTTSTPAFAGAGYEVGQYARALQSGTHMLGRFNQELKQRTRVVRTFPDAESCLRLVRALAVETHENWLEGTRDRNMQHLTEHKEALRQAA